MRKNLVHNAMQIFIKVYPDSTALVLGYFRGEINSIYRCQS